MKRYRLTVTLQRSPEGGMAMPGDVMERLTRVAPWAMGAFTLLTLAWWAGHEGPLTLPDLLAAAKKETTNPERLELEMKALADLGYVEISFLA